MSGLSEEDRESLARIIETTIGLGGREDPDCRLCGRDLPCPVHTAESAVFNLAPAIELIVTRAVNEAPTEAADAIEGWREMSHRRADDRSKDDHDRSKAIQRGNAYDRAARIVRARTT